MGYEKIINFSKTVEDPYIVGICVAGLKIEKQLETQILNCLENKNTNLIEFGKGYVYKRFVLKGYSWIDKLNIIHCNKLKKMNLLLVLLCTRTTFDLVKQVMGKNELDYWKKVDIRFVTNIEELNYAVEKLLNVGRPDRALWIFALMLHEDKNCDYNKELAIKCLKEMLYCQAKIHNMESYDITQIISNLQDSKYYVLLINHIH